MRNAEDRRAATSERVITIVGLIASVGLAIVLPIAAGGDDAKLDVILGTTGFVLGYLLTMDLATRSQLRSIEARLLERLDEVEDRRFGALPLQRLLTVPDIEDAVRDVVSAAADAKAKRMQFLANRTIERIKRDRDATLQISQGIFRCADRREELRLLRYALMDSRASMKAVASLGLKHWNTPSYQEYFETYLEFAPSVQQTRIFLVTPEEMADPAMEAILTEHHAAGVTVFALDKTKLEGELTRPIVLFDDELLLLHTQSQGDDAVDVHFTDEPLRVRDARESFDALLRATRRRRNGVLLWSAKPAAVAPAGTPPLTSAG
ncbi:MAG TPA: hypothetical protein VFT50_04485 [Baekduia sp.]|nr:hypothetical protein [Baekduia sp.]